MSCGEISMGSAYDCINPLQGGIRSNLILINFDDIAYVIYGETPGVIEGIQMKPGKCGFLFQGFRNGFTALSEKASAASGQALYKHAVNFFIYENTAAQKENIERMGNGRFVAIIQNTKMDANTFEALGIGAGLEMVDGSVNNKNENNGAYTLNLASSVLESKLPQTIFKDDLATTIDVIGNLLIPYTPPTGDWILITGFWDDGGVWEDTAVWID